MPEVSSSPIPLAGTGQTPGSTATSQEGKPVRSNNPATRAATAVLRRKAKKACVGSELEVFEDSSPVLGEGLDSLPEQSIHS